MKNLTINIDETGLCSVVSELESGRHTKKIITYTDLLDLLVASTETSYSRKEIGILSPILPGDKKVSTIQMKASQTSDTSWYILLREADPADFEYFGTVYKNVGLPKLIFAIKVAKNTVVSFRIMATTDYFIKPDTVLYSYPFSNVSGSGYVCTGDNYKQINIQMNPSDVTAILSIPEMFLAMPNSEHSYGHNKSGLYYRDMLSQLEGKPFNNEWLEPSGFTYQDFVSNL